MSDNQDITIGSPDSGVGDALTKSLDKLLLDNSSQDSKDDESEDQENMDNAISIPKKSSNGQMITVVPMHPHKFRTMSISSEDTAISGEEQESLTNPRTKQERLELLKELLETYFSDNYLTRDIFLLKHFRKSKEGWISLKFMASYKKIKRTAKTREEVEEAAKMSTLLELNEENTKIRRLSPFPACIDEFIPTRMTLIGALTKDMRNLASLSNFLSKYGEVASLQILRPGVNVPAILIETANSFPEMRDQWCALVEFDEIKAAGMLASDVNSGNEDIEISWALELVMPWKNRKLSERQEKTFWTEPIRNRCLSSPSSGYSSPCLTPDQSPHVCHGKHSPDRRGLSKRERIIMGRTCQTSSCCQQSPRFSPNCSPSCCQHSRRFSPNCSPSSRNVYAKVIRQTNTNSGYKSPNRPSSRMTAETCDNWRKACIDE